MDVVDLDHQRLHEDEDEINYHRDVTQVRAAMSNLNGDDDDPDLVAVPTEFLQEDVDTTIELRSDFRGSALARCVAAGPRRMLGFIIVFALIASLWVLIAPGERFSAADTLFEASGSPGVEQYKLVKNLQAVSATARLAQSRSLLESQPADSTQGAHAVTLVFGSRGGENALGLRQLQEMHNVESELVAWAQSEGVCVRAGAEGECLPPDSLSNYLFVSADPQAHQLTFDGASASASPGSCALPPFGDADVSEVVGWLRSRGQGGFLPPVVEANASQARAQYLRSTLFLSNMDTGKWFALAQRLYARSASWWSASWYVRLYYGGPSALLTAELLVSLSNDLLLLVGALLAILLYMRLFFGQWQLAGLGVLQLFIALPIMYWIVCVPFAQQPVVRIVGVHGELFPEVTGVVQLQAFGSCSPALAEEGSTAPLIGGVATFTSVKLPTIACLNQQVAL